MSILNTNGLTFEATKALFVIDKTFIGTQDYMGVAYFWGQDTKHWLRGATYLQRRKIHARFLKEGLWLQGGTKRHFEIICKVTGFPAPRTISEATQ